MVQRIKILARKNLKMSPGKLAAQAVHAALMLKGTNPMQSVVVLEVSDAKFGEAQILNDIRVVHDAGYTEVPAGTATCLAYFEDDPRDSIFNSGSKEST